MTFMIFDVEFHAPNLCVNMGMLNFMELCVYVLRFIVDFKNKLFLWFLLN